MTAGYPLDPAPIEMLALNAIFDAGGEIALTSLRDAVPANGRDLRKALDQQVALGNVRRIHEGEPVSLTASGRAAIAAGRAYRPLYVVRISSPRIGKNAARLMAAIAAVSASSPIRALDA